MTEPDNATRLRAAVLRRIEALLAKTTASGATEAEAMMAAEKAREMMDRYQIAEGELGLKKEQIARKARARRTLAGFCVTDRLSMAVAGFTDTKCWGGSGGTTFFGLDDDVAFAHYLIDALEIFIVKEAEGHAAARYLRGRDKLNAEKSFAIGCIYRIINRMNEIVRERRKVTLSDGRALVVVKSAIVAAAFEATGIKLRSRSGSGIRTRDPGAYAAGRAAGDRANFGRPLGSAGATARLK